MTHKMLIGVMLLFQQILDLIAIKGLSSKENSELGKRRRSWKIETTKTLEWRPVLTQAY